MPAPAWCRDLNMLAFLGSLAVSVGGTCITLGGLASVQAFCLDAPPLLGLGAGFRITGPLAPLTLQVLAIQKALFTAANGDFECGRFLQWDWWLWVLQLVFVSLVLAVWLTRTTRRYLAAVLAVGAMATAWHMERINYLLEIQPWTYGTLYTRGFVTAVGLIGCAIGNILLFFAMSNVAQHEVARGGAAAHCGEAAAAVSSTSTKACDA